jgi:hypothetical protein
MRRWLSLSKPPPPDMRIVYFGEQTGAQGRPSEAAIRSAILQRGEKKRKFV